MYVYSESVFNTLYIEIKNKSPSDKINVQKMPSFFFCNLQLITIQGRIQGWTKGTGPPPKI